MMHQDYCIKGAAHAIIYMLICYRNYSTQSGLVQ